MTEVALEEPGVGSVNVTMRRGSRPPLDPATGSNSAGSRRRGILVAGKLGTSSDANQVAGQVSGKGPRNRLLEVFSDSEVHPSQVSIYFSNLQF